jgi:NitT/TauT family transport system ATP-binding protein
MKESLISLNNISKRFHEGNHSHLAFKDMSFELKKGEFVSIFGPNGCGKTTLLHIIAGLDKDYEGVIQKKDSLKVSFVFQNYRESLFPWLTVQENMAFPLSLLGLSEEEKNNKVKKLYERLNIEINLELYPYQLSGGQQQIVSIARALITEPDILLLDEPFSALDYETTLFLREKIQNIWLKTGITIVLVTHDIDESILLSEKIIVLGRDPTRIVREVKSSISFPREVKALLSEEFHGIKNVVLNAFLEGYKK